MSRTMLLTLTAAIVAGLTASATAQEAKPINLSLFDPVQIFDRGTAIHGLRVNLIYGNNAEVKGVDLGLVNRSTGDFAGFQWGLANWTEGDFSGWQAGPVNYAAGFMQGVQSGGLLTMNESGKGVQWSPVNISDNFIGLQFGLVNYAVELNGLQLGLINIIKKGGMLPFFPIFNFSGSD